METALDVLSRAATMVQDNANESRLISKELPTSAWRRERRLRAGEYHHPNHYPSSNLPPSSVHTTSPNSSPPPNAHVQRTSVNSGAVHTASAHQISMMMAAAASIRPISESTKQSSSPTPHSNLTKQIHFDQISHPLCLPQTNSTQNDDTPLDMSVGNLKQRNSPPPPYREPLPGSHYASSLARPSVITQAPPKRDTRDSILVTNRENDNRSCESIDEHFRRSLGNDYFSLFTKTCSTSNFSLQTQPSTPLKAHTRCSSPTLPLPPGVQISPQQAELSSPPAYSVNFPAANSQYLHHQEQLITTSKMKNILLSPPILASETQIPTAASSPPLPLVVRSNVMQNQQQTLFSSKCSSMQAKTPLTSPQSPIHSASTKLANTSQTAHFSATGDRIASPIPLQQHPSSVMISLSHLSSLDNSPSSSPCHTPPVHNVLSSNPTSNIPAIIRIKTEPGLQNLNSKKTTPPASPTSTTSHVNNINSSACSTHKSSPSSPRSNWKSTSNSGNTSTEVIASVDDHFAKALGDTWKKLQENKEMRK